MIARSGNISELARRTGTSSEGLYKALSADGNPSLATVMKVSHALDLPIHFDKTSQRNAHLGDCGGSAFRWQHRPLLMLRVIRNGMVVAGCYLRLQVQVPDRPGSFAGLLMECAFLDANVVEVAHSRTSTSITVDEVEIRLELETKSQQHADHVIATLCGHGVRLQVE